MTAASTEKLAFTIAEAVKATGLSRQTLYRLKEAGELAMSRVYGRTVIRREHIEAMLAKAEKEPLQRPEAA